MKFLQNLVLLSPLQWYFHYATRLMWRKRHHSHKPRVSVCAPVVWWCCAGVMECLSGSMEGKAAPQSVRRVNSIVRVNTLAFGGPVDIAGRRRGPSDSILAMEFGVKLLQRSRSSCDRTNQIRPEQTYYPSLCFPLFFFSWPMTTTQPFAKSWNHRIFPKY